MKTNQLGRQAFQKEWKGLVWFLIIAGLVPFGMMISVQTQMQAILLTMGLNLVLGAAVVFFLRRERIRLCEIGLERTVWSTSLLLFGAWWVVITLLDIVSSWIAKQYGVILPREELAWSPVVVLDCVRAWVVVGLLEELAFRGYLHNKFAAVFQKKWVGITLAALAFGLWHIPASVILRGNTVLGALPGAFVFSLISFLFFNAPYELTGLLPLMCLFHGWSDFPILLTLRRPNSVGAIVGYVLFLVVIGIKVWRNHRQSVFLKGEVHVA